MQFEWDEAKRLSNIEKHGFDFLDADIVFAGPYIVGPARQVGDEVRSVAVGLLYDVYVTIIFTRRGDAIRLISVRRARDAEKRRYQEIFGD